MVSLQTGGAIHFHVRMDMGVYPLPTAHWKSGRMDMGHTVRRRQPTYDQHKSMNTHI